MNHADFNLLLETETQVFIEDQNVGHKSITNDAEWVVETLLAEAGRGEKEIVYKDTEGQWDVLTHDGYNFVGFAPYRGSLPLGL